MTTSKADRWFPDSMPPPMVDQDSLPWWQGAAKHKLLVQQCEGCGHCRLPPSPLCSECQSFDSNWAEVNGKGTLFTYTVVHRAVAMNQTLPFIIALVELDLSGIDRGNSVRVMTNIVSDAGAELALDAVKIGANVEVVWEVLSDEVSIPRFKLS